VEEAPSAALTPSLRAKMGEAAVNVARSCNYTGAGTVEFLLGDGESFYFLEMNTRLQVEHPVTEMITGLDLVREQINVAYGLPLSFKQEDLKINGHAIELRVCAEDPFQQFLPNIGKVNQYLVPNGPGIRVDDCMESNMEIPIYYDNMLAKLIAWGSTREQAIERLRRAIKEYVITGIETTLSFGEFVLTHDAFLSGKFDTHFIQKFFNPEEMKNVEMTDEELSVLASAAVSFFMQNKSENISAVSATDHSESKWFHSRKEY
jgi:acetyl/propionyl-CoA carboxylase alpha subunit